MLNVKLLNFFIALLIVSKFEIAFHFPVLSALTEAVRQKGSGIPGAKEKAPYVPGSTHRAGIVPDDGGRPKWAQLWQVSILPTTNSPYGAAIYWPPANKSYESLCPLRFTSQAFDIIFLGALPIRTHACGCVAACVVPCRWLYSTDFTPFLRGQKVAPSRKNNFINFL